jgi:hypothetical protein
MIRIIAICLLLMSGVAYSADPAPTPAKGFNQTQTQPEKNQQRAAQDKRGTKNFPIVVEILPAKDADEKSAHDETYEKEKSTNDSIIALGTVALAIFTFLLFLYTTKLVSDGRDTARKELRAYVALDDIYFRWIPNPNDPADRRRIVKPLKTSPKIPPRPRIRVKNYGHTPANNMTIRINGQVCAVKRDTANKKSLPMFESTYDGRDYQPPMQMLAPTQVYGVWVHLQDRARFDPHKEGYDPEVSALVIYGAITYEDIYNRWWVTRFCYVYDGYNRFVPHTDYNCEQQYKSQKDALDSLTYI